MKLKDVMSSNPVVFCYTGTTLDEAAHLMKKANCGVLPVLNNEDRLVGIITDRDICLSLTTIHHTHHHSKVQVREVMSTDVHFLHETDNFNTALRKMREHFIGRLPVLGEHGRLKGMVSIHSMLFKALLEKEDMGQLSSSGENIVKTVKVLSDRYAVKRHKDEVEEMNKKELPFVF